VEARGGDRCEVNRTGAFRDGKYATALPILWAERRGAPVVSFVRIDDRPIKVYSQIRAPDLVVVLDSSVMDVVDVLSGLKKGGSVLLNASHPVQLGISPVYTVDLTGIALKENLVVAGSPILNTPVLGALPESGSSP